MLIEKSNKNKKKRYEVVFDFFAYGYIALIVIILFSFALNVIATITGDEIEGIDVLNSLAHIATAFAFIFAVYQYRKNGEKERQIIIATEAKVLISKMSSLADDTKKNTLYTIEDINEFVCLMTNLGSDFMILYDALTDDIHKGMIRMRWQDMHYYHLYKTLTLFRIESLFDNLNLDKNFRGYSFINARLDTTVQQQVKSLQEYYFTKKVLTEMSIGEKIAATFVDLDLFQTYFFDRDETNDLMYGSFSILNFKASAPLLAAAKDVNKKV